MEEKLVLAQLRTEDERNDTYQSTKVCRKKLSDDLKSGFVCVVTDYANSLEKLSEDLKLCLER